MNFFKKIEINYSFSEWAPKATLMIIYIYYETGEISKNFRKNAKKFKNYILHIKILDYVDYIIGFVFYEEINVISKDQTNTRFSIKTI